MYRQVTGKKNRAVPQRKKAGGRIAYAPPAQRMETPATGDDIFSPVSVNAKSFSAQEDAVQRMILYPDGVRERTINQAETVTRFRDYGTTFTQLNGTQLNSGNSRTALGAPAFNIEPQEDKTVRLSIAAEAINALSYRMELPSAPPWEVMTDIAHVNEAVKNMRGHEPVYPSYVDPSTAIRLTVSGAPSDGTFAALVETHEDVHVQDNYAASRDLLEPWDERIHSFNEANHSVTAPAAEEAEPAFWAQIGATPAEKGKAFYDELRDRGNHFHQQDNGKGPAVDSMLYNKSTKHFILKLRHTMG